MVHQEEEEEEEEAEEVGLRAAERDPEALWYYLKTIAPPGIDAAGCRTVDSNLYISRQRGGL